MHKGAGFQDNQDVLQERIDMLLFKRGAFYLREVLLSLENTDWFIILTLQLMSPLFLPVATSSFLTMNWQPQALQQAPLKH